jgi:hypothetical protein
MLDQRDSVIIYNGYTNAFAIRINNFISNNEKEFKKLWLIDRNLKNDYETIVTTARCIEYSINTNDDGVLRFFMEDYRNNIIRLFDSIDSLQPSNW